MPTPAHLYRPLPGSALTFDSLSARKTDRGRLARYKLYEAPDHLLLIGFDFYSETYRRFFFPDIQVISLYKTVWGTVWNVVYGFCLIFLTALMLSMEEWSRLLPAVSASVVLVLLLRNLILGPTCACFVQTAVQCQKLHSLRRIKHARRIVDRLRPVIMAAQTLPAAPPASSAPMVSADPISASSFSPQPPS